MDTPKASECYGTEIPVVTVVSPPFGRIPQQKQTLILTTELTTGTEIARFQWSIGVSAVSKSPFSPVSSRITVVSPGWASETRRA